MGITFAVSAVICIAFGLAVLVAMVIHHETLRNE